MKSVGELNLFHDFNKNPQNMIHMDYADTMNNFLDFVFAIKIRFIVSYKHIGILIGLYFLVGC